MCLKRIQIIFSLVTMISLLNPECFIIQNDKENYFSIQYIISLSQCKSISGIVASLLYRIILLLQYFLFLIKIIQLSTQIALGIKKKFLIIHMCQALSQVLSQNPHLILRIRCCEVLFSVRKYFRLYTNLCQKFQISLVGSTYLESFHSYI